MLTLALDTANRLGGFALALDGELIASRSVEATDGFAGILYGEMESLLAEGGYSTKDVDVWAAAAGPGSFTGVRIGLAAVKAISDATDRPAVAIGNLEALAFAGRESLRAAVLDARRGQLFTALYDEDLHPLLPPSVGTWATFAAAIGDRRPQLLGVAEELQEVGEEFGAVTVVRPLAGPLALLAARRAAAGPMAAGEPIEPVYVRRPDVREPK